MTAARRLSQASLERLVTELSARDRAILLDLQRLRVLTGSQLTRLHFADLSPATRERTRRRVLSRLTNTGITATLDRRIGGVRAGSAGLVYALDTGGRRVLPLLDCSGGTALLERARRPWTPGAPFLAHTLDVSELYVQFREEARAGALRLTTFSAGPAAWHPTGYGGYLKPDAYVVVQQGPVEDSYWIECDRATESLPTLRRKFLGYIDFVLSGRLGPGSVVPQVLVTVPHNKRLRAVQELLTNLPAPGMHLLLVALHSNAVRYIHRRLYG